VIKEKNKRYKNMWWEKPGNQFPLGIVTSLENPAERTKLATWVDKMKNSNPAKLAILAAIIGIAYYLWPKWENEEVTPLVDPAVPAWPQIEAACWNQVPGIAKSELSLERKNQYGSVLKENTRENISKRWIQWNEWKATINELGTIPAEKVNADFLKLVSTVNSTPTILNVQALQQWIGMEAKDDKTAQDGILGPITTGQIRNYLSSCKR
jgi:hypothetical protein